MSPLVPNWVESAMAIEKAAVFKVPDDPFLAEVVHHLVTADRSKRIYLFGSVAGGDAGTVSDDDPPVGVPEGASAQQRRSPLAYEALRGTSAAADVLVCTGSNFEDRRLLRASLPGTVLRQGRLMHWT
jgi:hypothetical protein